MTNKVEYIEATTDIVEAVAEGLIDENTYYNCILNEDSVSDDQMLIKQLANAQWEDPLSNPADKDIKRGVSHLSEFNVEISSYPAAIACYGRVDVNREISTTVELNSSLQESESRIEDLDYQITQKDYYDLLSGSASEIKAYPVRILSVKDMKEPPSCHYCNGTGKITCPDCYGIGNGECPDCNGTGCFFGCEAGEQGFLRSKVTLRDYKLYYGDHCPTCNGRGSFKCKECNETGEISCFSCKGNSYEEGATSAQKVTRVKETYSPYMNGELFLPNGESMDFDVTMVKQQLCEMSPSFFKKQRKTLVHIDDDANSPEQMARNLFEELASDEAIIGVIFLAYSLPQIRIVTYPYNGEDYSILVIGGHAFAKELPAISLKESLFKSYKKKI